MNDEEEPLKRLTENVREELQAQNALGNLGLSEADIKSLTRAVATNVDYAFEVRWAPRWEGAPRSDQP